ncbi:MAG: hypothetical protein AAF242_11055 [Bacteroidota bacterium]
MSNYKEQIDKIKALVLRLKKEYKQDPNVLSVSWGMAKRGGKSQPEVAIIFVVKEKLKTKKEVEKKGSRLIPEEIEGLKTDVILDVPFQRQFTGERNDKMFDPLLGGVGSANLDNLNRTFFWVNGGAGTLGILCRDADGNAMALSNWHVWADDGAELGDTIIQPKTPDGGTYAESITKVAACGPLVTTVIEGRAPSGLAAGLYAGAAAAAILAGATDHKDPIRRGQEMTAVDGATVTHEESLALAFEYPKTIPWVGQPFATDVNWQYKRDTNQGEQTIEVKETQINPQILLGHTIAPNRAHYNPGERVILNASIWDYQNRPTDGYHLIAHLIPESDPDYVLRTLLRPSVCRSINLAPPYKDKNLQIANPVRNGEKGVCLDFKYFSLNKQYGRSETFGPISIFNKVNKDLRIINPGQLGNGLYITKDGLNIHQPPSKTITLRVAQFNNDPIIAKAFNNFGVKIAEAKAPQQQGVIHELTLTGNMMTRVEISGGGNEGIMFSYCFQAQDEKGSMVEIPAVLLKAYQTIDVPFISKPKKGRLTARRHCFRGMRTLPHDAPRGRYKVYLSVSNINHTAPGTAPAEAAKIIGGQQMGYTSQDLLCGFMLLGDHVFDIF